MKKKVGILLVVILLPLGLVLTVRSWTFTRHGRLHPGAAVLLKILDVLDSNLFEEGRSPEEIRTFSRSGTFITKGSPPPVKNVSDIKIKGNKGSLTLRIYQNNNRTKIPVILYFHGGGFVIGDLDSHDNLCRSLAVKTGFVVVSVNYRLAPENRFPAAHEDGWRALVWLYENAETIHSDREKIIVAGDSAGGNIAAALTLMTGKRNGPPIKMQVLFYPVVDLSQFQTNSHKTFARGYFLTREYIKNFRAYYLPEKKNWKNPLVSPLLAKDLSGLPPAVIVTAGFDILRDEGDMYVKRLRQAGVSVYALHYENVIHGFINMERLIGVSDQALSAVSKYLSGYNWQ